MVRHPVQNHWIEGEPIAAATRGRALNPITKPVMTRQPPSNRWRRTKHQPRGFMVEPTGVHDDRKARAIAWLTPMNRNAAIPSDRSPSPSVRRTVAEPTAAERRPECPAVPRLFRPGTAGHPPSPTWWGRHMACPQRQSADGIANAGSPCLRHGCVITASPRRAKTEALRRAHRAPSPIALRSNHEPLMTLALGVHEAESKMGEQVTRRVACSQRCCRGRHRGMVPEDDSGSLRWAEGAGPCQPR